MAINLQKGQRVSLDDSMKMALVGLGWDTNKYDGGKDFDLDAAAFLRRAGADPVIVRHLFRSDFETTMALAKIQVNSEYYPGGLIVGSYTEVIPNIQAIAGQAADALLTIENVRMTIVLFQLKDDVVGISARSSANLNVQVIMEQFGGGGHQTVAGAQVKNESIADVENQVTAVARKYIAESDKETE